MWSRKNILRPNPAITLLRAPLTSVRRVKMTLAREVGAVTWREATFLFETCLVVLTTASVISLMECWMAAEAVSFSARVELGVRTLAAVSGME